jgi:hypothetical protein
MYAKVYGTLPLTVKLTDYIFREKVPQKERYYPL